MSGRRAKDAQHRVTALLRTAALRDRYEERTGGPPGRGADYIRRTLACPGRPPPGIYRRAWDYTTADLMAPRPWGSTRRGRAIPVRWLRRNVRRAQGTPE